jgi:hypothetical protein
MEGGQLKQDEKLPKVNSYIICEVNFSKVILWAEKYRLAVGWLSKRITLLSLLR